MHLKWNTLSKTLLDKKLSMAIPYSRFWERIIMNYDIVRIEDLVNNPTTRVPICFCLDVSGSMNRIIGGDYKSTGRREIIDGKEWNVVEGGVSAIHELTEGVRTFFNTIREDEIASSAAEVCIVTFGGNGTKLVLDFASLERDFNIEDLNADGETPMGEAVNLALDCLERRKREYQSNGVDYFQPWLVLMTDGEPNGSLNELQRAIERTQNLVDNKKLTVFPIGIGPEADMNVLAKFSPKRHPLRLKGANFKELFQWLSQSVSRTSQSIPGEKVKLDIPTWGELD